MKHGNSPVSFKELGSSPVEYHAEGHTPGKKEIGPKVDPDAPGEPGTPGYEPPVNREDLDDKGKAIFDDHREYSDLEKHDDDK